MKILYISNQRRSADLAATALRNIGPKLVIAWTPHWSVAMRWVHDNRDLAALVVEAEVENQKCTSFVTQVRSLGLTAPVIVVTSEEVGAPLGALKAGADDYVASQSLLADLPDIVSRGVRRAQERQALEMQVVSARADGERIQREYAAARKDWEEAREHLQAAAAAEAANRERLDRQVREALASASETERRFNTAAEFLSEGKTLFLAMLDHERANRETLAQNLADAQAALQNAERRHASEMTTAAAQRAERQAQYDAELAQMAAARDTLAQQLRDAEGALERAQQDTAAVAAAAAERLTRREAELAATLAEATATRHTLERRLADTDTALEHADQRASVEQLAAAQASQRQSEVEGQLAQEVANRETLAQNLADAQAALQNAERRHASEMTTAAAQRAERQAQYDAELAQMAAARDTLAQQLRDAEGALERAQQDTAAVAAAAAERLTRREAELAATLAEATATRHTLERRLADTEAALEHADQRASVQQLAAAQASQRQSEVEGQLAQEVANRKNLERDLADARVADEQAQRRFLDEAAAASQRTREHEALLEERFARQRVDHENTRAGMHEEIRHLQLERDTLQQSRENLERARMAGEAELQRLAAEHAEVQQTLEQVRADLGQRFERASSEHAAERAKLETLVTERDAQLKEQAARHSAWQQAAKTALTQIEDGVRLAMEARTTRDRREIEQLQGALKARSQELEATRSDREVLRTEADRVPQLQNQLDDSQAENRRQFEHAIYGICRCARDGALRQVNQALVALLGYRTSDELRTVDFATTVFGSADDLRLLIERCLSKGTAESVETTWRRKDNGLLVVRLLALPAASESIEIIVEDITNLRALEGQLRQAQRMEAVARLASEVAGTCENLLRDVNQDAQQWLATIDRDSAFRRQGELLLHEVTRAAGFLRQLSVYGKKQMSALEPIDVNRVLRDLEPVLKQIAGDDIELVLPKTSSPVTVGVEAERVERLLVNVASYGRQRMPFGGRLAIQFATVVVSRKFVAKYPNVHPGDHVLITVTEARSGLRSDFPIGPREEPAGANTIRSASDTPGVDLGVLQGLIRDCGGHLWMKADPAGDMVLKMRLPQRVLASPAEQPTSGPRSDRGRSMARWFRKPASIPSCES